MIKLVNVEKTYYSKAGNIAALKKTNLEIKEGTIFGIIGLSGAGTSTLIRCINMLEVPTSGQVFVDGQEPVSYTHLDVYKRQAKAHQEAGVNRFAIVTATRALKGKDFDKSIEAYKYMHEKLDIKLCASMGCLLYTSRCV